MKYIVDRTGVRGREYLWLRMVMVYGLCVLSLKASQEAGPDYSRHHWPREPPEPAISITSSKLISTRNI